MYIFHNFAYTDVEFCWFYLIKNIFLFGNRSKSLQGQWHIPGLWQKVFVQRQLKQCIRIIPEAHIKLDPIVFPRVSFVRKASDLLEYSQTSRLETASTTTSVEIQYRLIPCVRSARSSPILSFLRSHIINLLLKYSGGHDFPVCVISLRSPRLMKRNRNKAGRE